MTDIPASAHRHTPEGTTIVSAERMNDGFVKYHLNDGRALHHFTAPDDGDPHDHPWSFETTILEGGYVEEEFWRSRVSRWGWNRRMKQRRVGETYTVHATHIHIIVELPTGECWTLVKAGPHERVTRFWRFGDTIQSRAWNEDRWEVVA